MKYTAKLLDSINRCMIPKLSKNYNEKTKSHVEIDIRNKNLDENFERVIKYLKDLTLVGNKDASTVISSLYILYKELKYNFPWNNDKHYEYARKLNFYFEVLGNVPLEMVLRRKSAFNVQEIFDNILQVCNSKLTSQDFKKYPALVDIFCMLITHLNEYKVELKPQKIFPILLLLIDDYITSNKRKGLLGSMMALQNMKQKDFDGGNYYEVLYRSLKRTFSEKDFKITLSTHECLIELCRIFPKDVKQEKLDDMYSGLLNEIAIESNIHRKTQCFKFLRFLLTAHGLNCVRSNTFKEIMYDSLELCTNEVVAKELLMFVLACLDEWVVQCWCVWQLSTDYKMISVLLKVLYTCKVEQHADTIQSLIIILICLNKESDKKLLVANLDKAKFLDDKVFKFRIEKIKLILTKVKF
ncbi:uncharacterized protein LOC112048495 [Bicyclus anynana]|uniref:Uncharacterized protein LOC112048495 n=1 Tax=Bicyclus anynana TaxID=110368 RepID=A0A6J1N9W6_BICAN|nr:uncharacterized protein LOC112048495 [Bicyclus anynana]